MADLDAARAFLQARFGFADFLPGQAPAIEAALDGEDIFVLAPTGAGKSLVYQLPALVRPGLTVVVSPLVALMRDQAGKLAALGLPAAALYAELAPQEYRRICDGLESRRLRLLYVSPERLVDSGALALLRAADVRALAVDEAHCVSQWGHDFRPDYRRIAATADLLGRPQIIATTATASPRAREDIVENLFVRPPRLFVGSFRRPAIALAALVRDRDRLGQIVNLVRARRGRSGIVYCRTREAADRVAVALMGAGLAAASYHAGLPAELRAARQDEFLERSDLTIVATIAFGLGVDKPDVRFVIHYDAPEDLETLYQESGRAGRDGLPAEAVALYSPRAMAQLRAARFDLARLDPAAAERARALPDYFLGETCREQALLRALGEAAPPCGRCDNCHRGGSAARRAARFFRAAPREAWSLARHGLTSGFAALFPGPATAVETPAPAPEPAGEDWTRGRKILTVEQSRRLERLRAARLAIARKARLAPVRIIGDEALIRMVDSPPASLPELVAAYGDASGFLARYGISLVESAVIDNV
ncbi:RecQ family ATP-dependent DNA helicase [Rhodoblastus acidophilus]|uniref:ATP-dependent DNA helicase RecQ n=1 Tax=Candidatus Rhodoblastus alkanivorans TaxID=2954117 RepID=A0ABS9Z592_9HYPH|nr:RecQ family ATP-dependent DNA helicase [Candidatus Rhodoblastus alkanivorans]MCI4677627.1 RecQ family ATP-dependent DNA helicase [Candidatus Rhodoblastus alkanivorans]MCI4682641.1 RecQ family ATP-dependent DNA helicase [Candidatus Rhodoblastus alkanivorans]MDI4639947.1 RecQ family ATP-dependent DNA helicase [Rhodoblastus acidophilus]